MNKMSVRGLVIFLSLLVINCGSGSSGTSGGDSGGQYPRFSSGDNEMVNFSFPVAINKTLSGDAAGVISGSVITLDVPNAADLTSLVAEYTINGGTVEVNGAVQSSGVTPNDFSKTVEYTVIAENGDKRVYSIVVNKAPSSEKILKAFSLNGIAGTIDENKGSVSVELPAHTVLDGLKASFESAGKSVAIGGTLQISGVTENNFSGQVIYTVTAEDMSKKDYTVTVTLLKDTAREMKSFSFNKADNTSSNLAKDEPGLISGSNITVELPYGTPVNALKAFFEISGESAMANGVIQKPGETVNDFSGPVKYIVAAEDGSSTEYTVDVTVAKSDAKAITKFILDGETAVIDENTKSITAEFPAAKDLSNLKASFITTGVRVSVGEVEQDNGVTSHDFSSAVLYTVTADNGSTETYSVQAVKSAAIAGLWNFDYGTDGSYTVYGATTTDGVSGSALLFNRGNYVLVADSDTLTLAEEGTIEAVIKADSHQPFAGVVHKGVKKDFSDESYSLQFWGKNGTDGTLRISLFNSAGESNYIDSGTKLATGQWYYVAATWNRDTIRLYINGNSEGSADNTIGAVRDSAGGLVIGAQLPVSFSSSWSNLVFNGTIDRVQISNRALTDAEISDHSRYIPAAAPSALTAYIIAVAAKNYAVIGGVLGLLIIVLIGIFVYNRKQAKALD